MTRARFSEVTSALALAEVPMRELRGPGHVAVTLTAGRVVALAFTREGPNLFWSNPQLGDTELVRNQPEKLVGGIGGDRLWLAPELEYHWKGVPQWDTLANYEVPAATDPGSYRFIDSAENTIALRATGQLVSHAGGGRVGFQVTRTIRMATSPLAEDDSLRKQTEYTGIEASHVLEFDRETKAGRLDLWHLLQVPVGSVLIVPLKASSSTAAKTLLSYALPGKWIQKTDRILWRYEGTAHAKIGLPASALTGRTAVLQMLSSEYHCLIVRQFRVDEQDKYADHPHGDPRSDQVFQAWDGLGFGEMEYHSSMLDARCGPRELRESDRLWAFGGSQMAIRTIAERLLGLDVADAFLQL